MKIICQECYKEVEANERHTFEDCILHKKKLKEKLKKGEEDER